MEGCLEITLLQGESVYTCVAVRDTEGEGMESLIMSAAC